MDPVRNPFHPGAGTFPPVLAGRDADLQEAQTLAKRVALGEPQRSIMLYGLRGVGKTVLLNRIEEDFQEEGYVTDHLEVSQCEKFVDILVLCLRKILLSLDGGLLVKSWIVKAARALKSFKLTLPEGPELSIDVEPLVGVADSGNLQKDLIDLFLAVGEAARNSARPVALFIDEAQYLSTKDFSALIAACHRVSQKSFPLVIVCAGLPQIAALAGEAKSYAERMFDFREIGTLNRYQSDRALYEPAIREGMTISRSVLQIGHEATEGYPYFIQEFGKQLWNLAATEDPTMEEAGAAEAKMVEILDQSFFKVRIDRATQGEKNFMIAMGRLGRGASSMADIAEILCRTVQSLAFARASLIKKGFIYSPCSGKVCFTVPHFDRYLSRKYPVEAPAYDHSIDDPDEDF